jgi:streptogramin lyase
MARNIQAAFARARSELRPWVRYCAAATAALLLVLSAAGVAQAATGDATEFGGLSAGANPVGIAAGPDGNLWFAERGSDRIGRISPDGDLTEFPLPTENAQPFQVAAGPDGNVWFTELQTGDVGRITPAGVVTEFPVCGYCRPWGITTGPEGDLWVTLPGAGELARLSTSGAVTRFPLGPLGPNEPRQIALGPDGNFWIADEGLELEEPTIGQIGRITPDGAVTRFAVPTPVENFRPTGIAAGPDGALWFTGSGVGVGRIDTSGSITEFPLPLFGERDTITAGPDGNLWFGNSGPSSADGSVDRLTPDGHLTTYAVPYGSRGISVGPDGNIWFTEWAGHAIGRITPGSPGIEVATARSVVRDRRTRISLYCSGGTPGSRCAGTAVLMARVHLKGRGRYPRARRVVLATARYGIADDDGSRITLRLRPSRLRQVRHGLELRVEVVARASSGVGSRRILELAFPHPGPGISA